MVERDVFTDLVARGSYPRPEGSVLLLDLVASKGLKRGEFAFLGVREAKTAPEIVRPKDGVMVVNYAERLGGFKTTIMRDAIIEQARKEKREVIFVCSYYEDPKAFDAVCAALDRHGLGPTIPVVS